MAEAPDRAGLARSFGVPNDLALTYEFVNSLDMRSFVYRGKRFTHADAFADRSGLREWLAAHDLAPRSATVSSADLELARTLRADLRAAIALHTPASDSTVRAAPRALARLPLLGAVDARGELKLSPHTRSGVKVALSAVLAEAVTASMAGRWRRLKLCASPDCRWAFFDASKPSTGRWCDTDICGNRVKKINQRRRQMSS